MKNRFSYAAFVAALAAFSCGCASHPKKMTQIKSDLAIPNYVVNTNSAPFRRKDVESSDKILYLSERARAFQLTGELEKSSEDYLAAEEAYEKLDDAPVVSISATASQGVAGTLANDLVLPYEGNPHERLMLHQLDAFNHLARLDWDGARVAANNIIYLSDKVRQRHEDEIRAAEDAAQSDGRFTFSSLTTNSAFRSSFAAADETTKTFMNALQNGYAYYFGAFVREVDGDYSGALIGYKRAAEVAPANTFVKRDIARMEAAVGTGGETPEQKPNVLVFFEEGFAPQLESFSLAFVTVPVSHSASVAGGSVQTGNKGGVAVIPLPMSMPLSVKFELPYYSREQLLIPSHPLIVTDGTAGVVAETQLVGDFRALAARAFKDRLPYIATRAAFRAIAKATASAIASYSVKDKSLLTRLAVAGGGMLLTQGTEFADMRTWLLAPRFGQVARWYAEPGERKFTFQHDGCSKTVVADVPADGTLVFHVISIPGRIIVEGTAVEP